MRLHRHDEIVEAIRRALLRVKPGNSDREPLGEVYARAALDALFEAVVRLEVGNQAVSIQGYEDQQWVRTYGGETPDTLILKLEPTR
jgi:hypothetical protein